MKRPLTAILTCIMLFVTLGASAEAAAPIAPANGKHFKDVDSVTLKWKLDPDSEYGNGTERIEWSRKPDTRPDGAFVAPAGSDGKHVDGENSYPLDLNDDNGTFYWHVQSYTCHMSEYPYPCNATTEWGATSSFTYGTTPVHRKPLTRAQLVKRRAEKRAARAVEREIAYDYGNDISLGPVHVNCRGRRGGYSCSIGFFDPYDASNYVEGRARVTQRGSRYSVSYRIYW